MTSEEQIKRQAIQDAKDAYEGYRVWPPYSLDSYRDAIWREAYERHMELLVMEDKR